MEKKIAIITLYGEFNFGNKLQNFALQTVLERMGYNVETLVFYSIDNKQIQENLYNKINNKIKKLSFRILRRKIDNKIHHKSYNLIYKARIKSFTNFSEQFIKTRIIEWKSDISYLKEEYDYFVIGSDQVWNPDYINKFNINFATFAKPKQRIVYAASIGRDEISLIYIKAFEQALQGLKHISVREEQAKLLLQRQFKVESKLVLDPTLLLDRSDWSKLINDNCISMPKEVSIVVTYFLGENTRYPKTQLKQLCEFKGWKIIDLSTIKNNKNYIVGPLEFLEYIKEAKLVLTDSFHGTVFSILFHTAFVVFKRDNQLTGMHRRLEQLLRQFDLSNREYDRTLLLENYLVCNFSEIDKIHTIMKKKSIMYLEEALRNEQ